MVLNFWHITLTLFCADATWLLMVFCKCKTIFLLILWRAHQTSLAGVTDLGSVLQNDSKPLHLFPFGGFCQIVPFWHRSEKLAFVKRTIHYFTCPTIVSYAIYISYTDISQFLHFPLNFFYTVEKFQKALDSWRILHLSLWFPTSPAESSWKVYDMGDAFLRQLTYWSFHHMEGKVLGWWYRNCDF